MNKKIGTALVAGSLTVAGAVWATTSMASAGEWSERNYTICVDGCGGDDDLYVANIASDDDSQYVGTYETEGEARRAARKARREANKGVVADPNCDGVLVVC